MYICNINLMNFAIYFTQNFICVWSLFFKVQHLEALVSIKDERIRDLTEQLDKCINNKTKENNGNHFFKNKRFN